jgi:hypothetical protein
MLTGLGWYDDFASVAILFRRSWQTSQTGGGITEISGPSFCFS